MSVYHADPVNYFILENQHTVSQLAERVPALSTEIQGKFFEILTYVVMQLNFVPCKELISLSLLLQQQQSIECRLDRIPEGSRHRRCDVLLSGRNAV